MVQMPVDEFVDPHVHLFDLKGTPRPMQPLGKMFGWNESVLRFMAKKLMPNDTISFFGEQTDLLGDYLPSHYRNDSGPSNVGRYVHIQAGWTDKKPLDPVGEPRRPWRVGSRAGAHRRSMARWHRSGCSAQSCEVQALGPSDAGARLWLRQVGVFSQGC